MSSAASEPPPPGREQPGDAQPSSVQDVFLQHLERSGEEVTIFLANGVKLVGAVARHDRFALILTRANHAQLAYKHAISTVMPGAAPPTRGLAGGAR